MNRDLSFPAQPPAVATPPPARPARPERDDQHLRSESPRLDPVLPSRDAIPTEPSSRSEEPGGSGGSVARSDATWAESVGQMSVAHLRELVLSQPVVEQAKGVLMGYYGVDEASAFAILRRWSSVHGVKLRDLASVLVDHASVTPPGRASSGGPDEWRPFDGIRAVLQATGLGRT